MRFTKALVVALSAIIGTSTLSIAGAPVLGLHPQDQQTSAATVERGYRTGYSDGYQAGFRDVLDGAPKDHAGRDEYKSADRAYSPSFGRVEDYQDGYRRGFETGYLAGYERRIFDSSIPAGLTAGAGGADPGSGTFSPSPTSIPANTALRIELLNDLSTDVSQLGDRFKARVIEPADLEGAIIEGHIARLRRPGKVKGTAELQLTFDKISVNENRAVPFRALVVGVVTPELAGIGSVDAEGGIKGKDSTGSDVKKVGAGSAVGAVIGAIAGGGKGAAIGAAIGGGAATGGVMATRGDDLRLGRGQQLNIQTSTETEF
jgi:hypothetical protein